MGKVKSKKILIIFMIILIIILIIFVNKNSTYNTKKNVETTQEETTVSRQTILSTITASGEVESATKEKITLNTNYYYLNMCVEENELVKAGENLLKYTNGTYLTAPYDCIVLGYSLPDVKSICTSSNYIYIASVEELYMNININEEQINNILVGQEVEIISNSDETKKYTGIITKINAIGTKGNGGTTFSAIASIENDGNLKIGMSASCTITLDKSENVLALPIESVEIENNEKYANIINEDGTTERVKIETGKADANYVEVLSGLLEGDNIVYEKTTVTTENNKQQSSTKSITSLFEGNKEKMNKGGFDR